MIKWICHVAVCSLVLAQWQLIAAPEEWKPAKGPLLTRWGREVTPENVHPEHPRPQMQRAMWLNLNGLWEYAIRPVEDGPPSRYDGKILVPFPVESALSGVMKRVGPDKRLWYRMSFPLGGDKLSGKRMLLNFGAVDWETVVWVNGQKVGEHRGGYDPFIFDITTALNRSGVNEIVVAVWDPTDAGFQPRGKQVRKPRGIWYTPTTGIWQTVWLEVVPLAASIDRLRLVPDIDAGLINVTAYLRGVAKDVTVKADVCVHGRVKASAEGRPGETMAIPIDEARLWSPDSPFLYGLQVRLHHDDPARGNVIVDAVASYFGMRKISLGKDESGVLRLFLNNEPLFQYGPLDQGFWPDGLYTAPSDEALRYDIEVTKKLGFNMARKHVKIEPDRWYYWCDKLGLLVWQDMPSGDRYIGGKDPDLDRVAQSARQFELELKRSIDAFGNHPSIVMWVPFNEGWGQYDTMGIVNRIKAYDPTRLVNNASGWTDRGVGDVHDIHSYPGPAAPKNEPLRAAVLGEFGGLGLPVKGHTWQAEKNWGYRSFESREALTGAYVKLLRNLKPLIGSGLAAAVYTQTTDVEIEVNGLMTYDRAMIKMDEEKALEAARRLFLPPPRIEVLMAAATIPDSMPESEWRYTFTNPGEGWFETEYDDSGWKTGIAGFGKRDTPGALVQTEWGTADIWIRRTFDLGEKTVANPCLQIHHDEDAKVYLNGRLVAELGGYTTSYILHPLDEAGAAALRKGRNVAAVHCRQTQGGQYIDLGLVNLIEEPLK